MEKNKKAVVEALNRKIGAFDNGIRFILEQEKVIAEIFNKETKKAIKRIPPEDVLKSFNNISKLVALLIDK